MGDNREVEEFVDQVRSILSQFEYSYQVSCWEQGECHSKGIFMCLRCTQSPKKNFMRGKMMPMYSRCEKLLLLRINLVLNFFIKLM